MTRQGRTFCVRALEMVFSVCEKQVNHELMRNIARRYFELNDEPRFQSLLEFNGDLGAEPCQASFELSTGKYRVPTGDVEVIELFCTYCSVFTKALWFCQPSG